ncbi:MAG TPA: hypothetical protein VKB86_03365 [Pyrinomonadaceae bacterium]|nr:hypothetical protein [Pyrinomonadaceae bacterium]
MDYCNGRVTFPVRKIVRGIIEELVKVHYPAHYTAILNYKASQVVISWYVIQFKKILISAKRIDIDTYVKYGGKSPVDDFAYINAHQFVNLISPWLEDLEKKHDFVPLRLQQNIKDEESLDHDIRNVRDERETPEDTAILRDESGQRNATNKARWGCFILILVAIMMVVYLVTASLNPLAVYRTSNILAKVIVSILAGLLALLFLQMFSQNFVNYIMRKSVERGTSRSADQAICSSCGLSVFLNKDTLGLPIVCHTCHVAWHDGPECYRKGMPLSNAMLPPYPCPNCRSSIQFDSR